jgi:hypothetical protein
MGDLKVTAGLPYRVVLLDTNGQFMDFAHPLKTSGVYNPLASIYHRTITGLDGKYPPLSWDPLFAVNPEGNSKARFTTNITVRGCTALTDEPVIVFRPYVIASKLARAVGAGESVAYTRPRLKDLASIKFQKTINIGAAYTDYSANVIDNNVATYADLDALDTVANGDWVVIGGPVPFIGAALDLTANVNTNNSVMTVQYWNGAAWVAVANLTDGTILVVGKTLSGDGQISWDNPALGLWVPSALGGITAYWVRVSVSAALSATVEVAECDLLMPIKAAIDVQVDGDDALLFLEEQSAAVTGTVAYSGTVYLSWR